MVKVQANITKDELMSFDYLESREYQLPSEYAIDSFSSTKTQLKRKEVMVTQKCRLVTGM